MKSKATKRREAIERLERKDNEVGVYYSKENHPRANETWEEVKKRRGAEAARLRQQFNVVG